MQASMQAEPSTAARLPNHIWSLIVSFLDDPHDILSFCAVNRRMRKIGSSNPIWSAVCMRAFPEWTQAQLAVLNTRTMNWKLAFARQCKLLERNRRPKWIAPPNALDTGRDVCAGCNRPPQACFCSTLPAARINNEACPVLILQDTKTQTSIGTVQILQLCLTHCTVINDRDYSIGRHPELDAMLATKSAYLLFPSVRAKAVSDVFLERKLETSLHLDPASPPPRHAGLIAIDGSWRTAKSIYRWNPHIALSTIPVQITNTAPSIFGEIKREPKSHFLSTMEAVGKALGGLVHGDEEIFMPTLLPPLRHIVDTQSEFARESNEKRGKIPKENSSQQNSDEE